MARTALKTTLRAMQTVILTASAITIISTLAFGQVQNGFDTGTPAESRGGTALLSSFAQDKVETVNLANGNLSVHVPLVTVGGRGSASYTVALAYNSKLWTGEQSFDSNNGYVNSGATYDDLVMNMPNVVLMQSGWFILRGPVIKTRLVQIDWTHDPGCPPEEGRPLQVLTRMWLVLPDGSEVELRDNLTDGQPSATGFLFQCQPDLTDRNRGAVWHSTDGSAITYVTTDSNGGVNGNLAGYVFFADGTRMHIRGGGKCDFIYDRNGNYIRIQYDDSGLPDSTTTTYTDQLGRQVILQYSSATGATVTVKGYNGMPDRSIQVLTDILAPSNNAQAAPNLRADYQNSSIWPRPFINGDRLDDCITHTLQYPHTDLFACSNDFFYDGNTVDQHKVVTRLNLLDGRSFQFRYNVFGELAEIVYPTGGTSQIDYAPFGTSLCEQGGFLRGDLNRRVSQRRNYNGGTLEATWLYSRDTATVNGGQYPRVTMEVHQGDQNGALMAQEKHYFLNLDKQYLNCTFLRGNHGTGYEYWDNAKEFQTERLTGNGTETVKRSWEQRTAVAWDPNVQPQNDPRVTQEDTLLENGKMHRIKYEYDNNIRTGYVFNNVTDVKEYDWGTDNNPGALLRETLNTYVSNLNGYCYVNLNGPGGACGTGVPSSLSDVIHKRRLVANQTVKDGNGNVEAYTEYEYDNYVADTNHAALVSNPGMAQYDSSWFADFSSTHQPRANVTSIKRLISGAVSGGTYTTAYSQYDEAGNVVKTLDPLGHPTTISYQDNFGDGTNPDVVQFTPAAPTFALPTQVTNALTQSVKTQYDYTRGAVAGVKDANSTVTRTTYDNLDRPLTVEAGYGLSGPENVVTKMSYPSAGVNETKVSHQLDGTTPANTRWLTSRTQVDGFGRTVLASQSEDGKAFDDVTISYTIHTKTIYDGLGRAIKVSNPYRSTGGASTDGWARTSFDLAGRVTEVATFEGDASTPPPDSGTNANWTGSVTTTYSGEVTSVVDQAHKQRRSTLDALGRLKVVDEMNEWPATTVYATTSYGYDARGNLLTVTQAQGATTQTRRFAYDKLSRMLFAANPEQTSSSDPLFTDSSGFHYAVRYDYDVASNLTDKTDTRPGTGGFVTVHHTYDSLNRVLQRSYPHDTTPAVNYVYDTAANGKGQLRSVTAVGVSTYEYTAYDHLGRPTNFNQQMIAEAQTYQMSCTYNKAGLPVDEGYPSGKVMHTEYDSAGRPAGVQKQGAAFYYAGDAAANTATRAQYTAAGAVSQMRLGNNLWEHTNYNSRLQPVQIGLGINQTSISVLGLDYTYGLRELQGGPDKTTNNGDVESQTISAPGATYVQNYTYDVVNRISTAKEAYNGKAIWTQSYGYDRWGNRTSLSNSGSKAAYMPTQSTPAVDGASNRLAGVSYDNAGNLGVANYDAESRIVLVYGSLHRYQPGYDGDGRRVKQLLEGGQTLVYVYDAAGRMVAEYDSTAVSLPNVKVSYLTADHLGSTRVVTGESQQVRVRRDYCPYGEELPTTVARSSGIGYGASEGTRQRFTGKEREVDTGLDYFLARYYSSQQGRFTSVDPENAGATRKDPQSWNGYAYSRNNPLKYIDPEGLKYRLTDLNGNSIDDYSDENFFRNFRDNKNVKLKDGNIFLNGELIGTYERLSFDDFGSLGNGVYNGLSARRNASLKAIGGFAVGTAIVGATGGGAAYFGGVALGGGSLTTLGVAGGPSALTAMGATDAAVFSLAIENGASATAPFFENLAHLSRALGEVVKGAKVNLLGQLEGSPIYGSLRSGIGIVERHGVTYIVRAVRGQAVKILGKLGK